VALPVLLLLRRTKSLLPPNFADELDFRTSSLLTFARIRRFFAAPEFGLKLFLVMSSFRSTFRTVLAFWTLNSEEGVHLLSPPPVVVVLEPNASSDQEYRKKSHDYRFSRHVEPIASFLTFPWQKLRLECRSQFAGLKAVSAPLWLHRGTCLPSSRGLFGRAPFITMDTRRDF